MAKIKLSSVGITNISGKAGGSIYSRNRGGAYVKNFVIPTNPNTLFQQNVRSIFAGNSQSWKTLTEEQRNSFEAQAPNYTSKDVFGDGLTYTGSQLHQKLNGNLQLHGELPLTTAKPPAGTMPINSATITAAITAGVFSLDGTVTVAQGEFLPGQMRMIVEAAPPASPSQKYQQNRKRFVQKSAFVAGAGQDLDLTANYVDRFFEPVEGQMIALTLKVLNVTTGELSTGFEVTALVTSA